MKNVFLFIIVFNPLLSTTSCSSAITQNNFAKKELREDDFSIAGKWIIQEIKFVGDPNNVKFSDEINLYSLLGVGWNETKGKSFFFEANNHWSSTIFENEIDQKSFSYSLESLVLTLDVKGEKLNFRFPVSIKYSSLNSMTWDIGNDINLLLVRE